MEPVLYDEFETETPVDEFAVEPEPTSTNKAYASRQAAFTALSADDVINTYNRALQQYQSAGSSEEAQAVVDMGKQFHRNLDIIEAQDVIARSDPNDPALIDKLAEIQSRGNVELLTPRDVAAERVAMGEETINEDEEETHFFALENMAEILGGKATSDLKVMQAIQEMSPVRGETGGGIRQAYDIGRVFTMPGQPYFFHRIVRNAFPELELRPVWDRVFMGTVKEKVQEHIRSLPTTEAKIDAFKRFANAITQEVEGNILGFNNFEVWDYWDMIVGDFFAEADLIMQMGDTEIGLQEANELMLNFFGALDMTSLGLGAGTAARSLTRNIAGRAGASVMMRRAARSSPIEVVGQVAPRRAKNIAITTIETDQGVTRRVSERPVGEDPGVIQYEHGSPKQAGDEVRSGFDLDVDYNIDDNPILSTDFSSAFFSRAEREAAQQAYTERARHWFGSQGDTMHLSKSEFETIGGGFRARYRIGHTSTSGFSSLRKARAAAQRYREVQNGARYKILERDYESGLLVEYAPRQGRPNKGEYFIEIEDDYFYSPKDFQDFGDDFFVGVVGRMAKYLDKSSLFQSWFVNASNVAADRSSAVISELVKLRRPFTELSADKIDPVIRMIELQERQGRWFDADEYMTYFDGDMDQVAAAVAHQRHAKAMRQLENRRVRRSLVAEGNKKIVFFGKQVVKDPQGGQRSFIGKVEQDVPNTQIRSVYDPKTDQIIPITMDEVRRMYESGEGRIITLTGKKVQIGNKRTQFAIDTADDRQLSKTELPQDVIKDIPGYTPRVYDANYVIGRLTNVEDNGEYRQVLVPRSFARTRADAEAELIAQQDAVEEAAAEAEMEYEGLLNSSATKEEIANAKARYERARRMAESLDRIVLRKSNELRDVGVDQSYVQRRSMEYLNDAGRLFTSSRGELLSPLREGGMDGRAGLVNPLEAIEKAEAKVANSAARNQFIDNAIARWEQQYGDAFGIDGKMPLGESAMRLPDDPKRFREYQEARALRDHILLVAGIDNTMLRKLLKEMFESTANRFFDAPRASLMGRLDDRFNVGDYLIDKSKTWSPTDEAKRLSFLYHIVANPIRQAVLQSTQATVYLSVPGAIRYATRRDGFAQDYLNLVSRLLWPEEKFGKFNRAIGDQKEADRLYQGLLRTGLVQATDTHQYHIGFAADLGTGLNADRAFLSNPRNVLSRTARLVRRAGFDVGENNQLIQAFLFERNRWMDNNPEIASKWDLEDNLAEIAGNARQLSFNMNSSGALAIQRGWMSVPFQFMSHSMKALQVLVPQKMLGRKIGKLSNKYIAGEQRKWIALQQFAIFGTGWLGMSNAVEWAAEQAAAATGQPISIPQDVSMVLREGMFGSALNMFVRMLNGEELFNLDMQNMDDDMVSELMISGSFAPFSGLSGLAPDPRTLDANPLTKLYEAIFMTDGSLAEIFGGATYVAGENVLKRLQMVAAASGATYGVEQQYLQGDPVQQGLALADEMLRILPVYNNFVKSRGILNGGKMFFGTNDQMTVQGTKGEAWAKTILGLQSARERDVADLLYGDASITRVIRGATSAEVNDIANTLYARVLNYMRKFNTGEIDEYEFARLAGLEHLTLKIAIDDKVDLKRIQDRFKDKVFSDLNESQEAQLLTMMTNGIQSGSIKTLPEVITDIQNRTPFEGQQQLVDYLSTVAEYFGHGRFEAESP